jgi:glycosyltransferase involved in cell wall biosynthesis
MSLLPADSPIRLTLGGEFSTADGERRMRTLPGFDRVDFLGWVERPRIREVLADARAGLMLYQPTPNVLESEPVKLYEVLAAGLPVIASDIAHWRRFIDAHDCGILVPHDDPRAIANAIQSLVDDPDRAEAMGRRGRALIAEELNWERESRRLFDLYERLAPSAPSATAEPDAMTA